MPRSCTVAGMKQEGSSIVLELGWPHEQRKFVSFECLGEIRMTLCHIFSSDTLMCYIVCLCAFFLFLLLHQCCRIRHISKWLDCLKWMYAVVLCHVLQFSLPYCNVLFFFNSRSIVVAFSTSRGCWAVLTSIFFLSLSLFRDPHKISSFEMSQCNNIHDKDTGVYFAQLYCDCSLTL